MDLNSLFTSINEIGIKNIFFMLITMLFAIFYFFYSLVISKQVKVMDRALHDKYNPIILFVTSFQITLSMIVLIVLLLSIFII